MLLQTNSYIVPKDRRAEHARLMHKFRQCFKRLGSHFEVYEQTGPGFTGDGGGRYVQIMRFRDRHHQQQVQSLEKSDRIAQQLIATFCKLVNLPYQQEQGLFAAGFYVSVVHEHEGVQEQQEQQEPAAGELAGEGEAAPPAAADPPGEPAAPAKRRDEPVGRPVGTQ